MNHKPVTAQLREVQNGYPSTTILPFSEVTLNPSSVNVSEDASVATTFTFPSPVYIQENVEYCFVVLANTQEYNMWISRVGQTNKGTDRTISQQAIAVFYLNLKTVLLGLLNKMKTAKFKIKRFLNLVMLKSNFL